MRVHVIFFLALWLGIAAGPAGVRADDLQEFKRHTTAGENYYHQGKNDAAIREFQAAVKLKPNDSWAHLWLGRALGRKAEKANALRAAFLVGDIRRELERAVDLDPRNLEARSDLMSFYLDAPSMFGGGVEKARKQADEMAKLDAAEGHSAHAKIAEKEKKYDQAESEYRAAIEANPNYPGYRRDLEKFQQRRAALEARR